MTSKTITLTHPITVGDSPISELRLRKLLAGELRGIKVLDILQMDPAQHAQLIPRIAEDNITAQHVYALELEDLTQVMVAVIDFFVTDTAPMIS